MAAPRLTPRLAVVAIACLALLAVALVGSTWRVFSQVADEPAHIAAGMEWVAQGEYTYETQHPPLARALFAAGPFLRGVPYVESGWLVEQGNAILYHGDRYSSILAAARAGNIPFVVLAFIAVAFWSWRLFGPAGSILAVVLTLTLPPLLGHAGLATTDFPVAAGIVAALAAWDAWLDRPTCARGAILGAALAVALTTKFSAVAYLPPALLLVALAHIGGRAGERRPPRARAISAALALAVALVLGWSAYRFSVAPLTLPDEAEGAVFALVERFEGVRMPAPEFVRGVTEVLAHDRGGHRSYLMGQGSEHGWWYYFPVALLVKTPIPFLVLLVLSPVVLGRRETWRALAPWAAGIAILGIAMTSSINIGIRHVLPLYPLFAVAAGGAAAAIARRGRAGVALVAILLLWQAGGTAAAHPDHLAWFNEIARRNPDAWLADSNLDWGQDLLRLSRETRERKIESLRLAYFGTAIPERHKLPRIVPLREEEPATGWIAVSRQIKIGLTWKSEPAYTWLDPYEPVEVGKSILLYYVPPEGHPDWAR